MLTNHDVLAALTGELEVLGYRAVHLDFDNQILVMPLRTNRARTAAICYSLQDGVFRVRRADVGFATAREPWELDVLAAEPRAIERIVECIDRILVGTYSPSSKVTCKG